MRLFDYLQSCAHIVVTALQRMLDQTRRLFKPDRRISFVDKEALIMRKKDAAKHLKWRQHWCARLNLERQRAYVGGRVQWMQACICRSDARIDISS